MDPFVYLVLPESRNMMKGKRMERPNPNNSHLQIWVAERENENNKNEIY